MKSESPHASSWTFIATGSMFVLSLLIATFAVVVTAFSPSPSSTSDAITLPIEVYPPDGVSAVVEQVTVDVSGAADVDSLFIEAHQPFYNIGGWENAPYDGFDAEGAASIRVNGGPWVDVRDENVDCAWPESSLSCVAGAYATIRFTLPATNVVDGANTIEFRFNGTTDNTRSGFRILNFGFMTPSDPDAQMFGWQRNPEYPGARIRAVGAHGAQTTPMEWYDPSTWSAPSGYDNATDVSAGQQLYQQENRLVDLNGESMRASCGSCHAANGRDLQYFNFSNESIVSRSVGHGLTEQEGRQIAAYIRSIDIERVSDGVAITPPGSPWDPAYQPGFGYGPNRDASPDEVDPVYWAAGAGLGWVFNNDSETLPYVFPKNGNPSQGLAMTPDGLDWSKIRLDAKDADGNDEELNMREIPISIQFPDWNNWLPDIHPMDYMPSKWDNSTNAVPHYETTLPQAMQSGNLSEIDKALRKFNDYFRDDGLNNHSRPAGWSSSLWLQAELSSYQWKLVKVWELQQQYGYEDKADEAYCWDDTTPYCEPLGWLSRARHAFDVSPHITGSGLTDTPFVYGNVGNENYMMHVWYQLGATLNPGTDPHSSGQQPVDWGYQEAFVEGMVNYSGVSAEVRQFVSEIKNFQQFSNAYGADGTGGNGYDRIGLKRGWSPAQSDFDRLLALPGGGLTSEERDMLIEAGLRAWHDYNRSIPLSDFARTGEKDNKRYMSTSYVPDLNEWTPNTDWPQKIYQSIHRVNTTMPGVSKGLLDSLALWGDDMWPDDVEDYPGQPTKSWPDNRNNPRWDALVDYSPPSTGTQPIDLRQGWNIISSAVVPDDASMEAVFSSLGSSLVLVKNETGESYIPEFNVNTIGSWRSDEAYKVFVTANEQISMDGTETDPTSAISLQQGWNLVAFWPESSMAAEDAFSSLGSALVIVKDAAGNAYVPGESINTLDNGTGQVHPGQGYQVYVSADADLVYPTSSQTLASISGGESKAQAAARGVASSASIVVDAPGLDDGTKMIAETRDGTRVGTGQARDGKVLVRVWGHDPQNPASSGAESGDDLTLRVPARNDGERVPVSNTRNLISSATASTSLTFQPDALLATTADLADLELALRDNYPNPVQSSTNIEFVLPAQQRVEIEVYDLLGRRVSTVMDDTMPAGTHKVAFDASRLSSGTYFYRMRSGGKTFSRKMVVVR